MRDEEEEAILDQRSAERAAELVPLEAVAGALAGGRIDRRKRARPIEAMVPRKFERVAVEHVGARLGGNADRAAGLESVLRVLRARLYAELLHGVGERQGQVHAVIDVVVQRTVEEVCHAELLASGDGDPTALREAPARGFPVSTAAPAIMTSITGFRPSSGSASTCSLSMTAPIAGLRVSTSGAAARRTPSPRRCQVAASRE